ncbi:hypothetical protein BD408DRAFT_423759 [Parasitella parasitica]|nr:hypothetical protein BD408DRAFT_423759 [Parasitella parasitica]
MDRNNRYPAYDRALGRPQQQHQQYQPQQQHQQQQAPYMQQGNNFRRDDFGGGGGGAGGGGGGGNRRGGGGGGGGAMRDQRGGRRHNNNERFNDSRPYNKRAHRPHTGNNFSRVKSEPQDDSDQLYDNNNSGFDFDDNNRLPAHIESRVAREKPCRTLFVRNVQYTIPESEVRALFEKFGEVKDVFNLIENRGMIFITFYDVRAAEEAKTNMQGIFLSDRKIDVHYSLPKEEEERAKCDRTKNQGTLLYTLKNANGELDDYELQSYFGRFGDIKAIRVPHFKKSTAHNFSQAERNQQRLVEFYDSRACVDAFDETYDTEYLGGRWDVAFFWDHPYKDRTNSNQRREKNHDREREDSKASNRRRNDSMRPREYDHYSGGGQSSGRNDERYIPPGSAAPPPAHHNTDPRLQYNPHLQHQLPLGGAPTTGLNNSMPDGQRLEQAQKAQQMLSMLAYQPAQQPQVASLTSPFQPTNLQSPPTAFVPPVPPVPPTEDQASQVQQLLGLLSQAAQQQQQQQQQLHQQQQQQQHQQQHQQQQQQQQHKAASQPPIQQGGVAPIPGMDPATALSQLAALLQQQQQNNNQHQ